MPRGRVFGLWSWRTSPSMQPTAFSGRNARAAFGSVSSHRPMRQQSNAVSSASRSFQRLSLRVKWAAQAFIFPIRSIVRSLRYGATGMSVPYRQRVLQPLVQAGRCAGRVLGICTCAARATRGAGFMRDFSSVVPVIACRAPGCSHPAGSNPTLNSSVQELLAHPPNQALIECVLCVPSLCVTRWMSSIKGKVALIIRRQWRIWLLR
jgi:hypothetical protein